MIEIDAVRDMVRIGMFFGVRVRTGRDLEDLGRSLADRSRALALRIVIYLVYRRWESVRGPKLIDQAHTVVVI